MLRAKINVETFSIYSILEKEDQGEYILVFKHNCHPFVVVLLLPPCYFCTGSDADRGGRAGCTQVLSCIRHLFSIWIKSMTSWCALFPGQMFAHALQIERTQATAS